MKVQFVLSNDGGTLEESEVYTWSDDNYEDALSDKFQEWIGDMGVDIGDTIKIVEVE